MKCVLWYMHYHSAAYELFETEREAAEFASFLFEAGDGAPTGVQFEDGRLIPIKDWDTYKTCQDEAVTASKSAALEPLTPTRKVRDPFEGQTVNVEVDEPRWIGISE